MIMSSIATATTEPTNKPELLMGVIGWTGWLVVVVGSWPPVTFPSSVPVLSVVGCVGVAVICGELRGWGCVGGSSVGGEVMGGRLVGGVGVGDGREVQGAVTTTKYTQYTLLKFQNIHCFLIEWLR